MSAPTFDADDKAQLDEIVRVQRMVCDDLDDVDERIGATTARAAAGRVLQQLLVWQQTCKVAPPSVAPPPYPPSREWDGHDFGERGV